MRVLLLMDSRPCGHCYGTDFLIQGAYNVLGAENVLELPEKPNLHLPLLSGRDECQIDSDAWLPSKGTLSRDTIRAVDLVIITTAYGLLDEAVREVRDMNVPVVGLHYDDESTDTRPMLEGMIGRKLAAYWHRENPPPGAKPLWFSQPRTRVRSVAFKRPIRDVFYHGSSHGLSTRYAMAKSLQDINPDWCTLTETQSGRLLPEVYRERLWESRIAPVWNSGGAGGSFPVYQSNRLIEALAMGCAVVAEKPLRDTDPTFAGIIYVRTPEEIGPACRYLARDAGLASSGAVLSQEDFLSRGTSEALFRRIISEV